MRGADRRGTGWRRALAAAWIALAVHALPATAHGEEGEDDLDVRAALQGLREEMQQMRQQLQEIRALLLGKRPAAPQAQGWEPVDALELKLGWMPVSGSESASLLLVEFSDYQCPFCARHALVTYPELERDFVATGRLRYVVADFPLAAMHPEAMKAAEAAHCAADQGRFTAMYQRLFSQQRQLDRWDEHAAAVGLDAARFRACLDDGRHREAIQRSLREGQRAGVQGTPTFFLAQATPDGVRVIQRLRGAQPYALFKSGIEAALAAR